MALSDMFQEVGELAGKKSLERDASSLTLSMLSEP
jgi:hypothetical protein